MKELMLRNQSLELDLKAGPWTYALQSLCMQWLCRGGSHTQSLQPSPLTVW